MSDATPQHRRRLIDIALGMGGSIVAGVVVVILWRMQNIVRLGSSFYALLIPLAMGVAGSFWWRRQLAGGWPLWKVAIVETLAIFLVLFAIIAPNMSRSEWGMVVLGFYIMVSPLIALSLYIGARLGSWLLDRRAARHDSA